ncbi:winged helix-turn-helix domain-containing protein [Coleofasciculus sp. FACHB-501]|nr:winged helix-turn-helix domain-containing protein [Coleofasciculus sp. FACHB-501]
MLNKNPNASVQEIAEGVELSIYQVKRHLSKLKKNIF